MNTAGCLTCTTNGVNKCDIACVAGYVKAFSADGTQWACIRKAGDVAWSTTNAWDAQEECDVLCTTVNVPNDGSAVNLAANAAPADDTV
jgi:hypothetical protein